MWTRFPCLVTAVVGLAIVVATAGCVGSANQFNPMRPTDTVVSPSSAYPVEMRVDRSYPEILDLQQLISADLIIEGTVTGKDTRIVPFYTTEAELAEIESSGEIPGVIYTDYEITIDKLLKGQAPSKTIIVTLQGGIYKDVTLYNPENPLLQLSDRVILFLRDISDDPVQAPGQTKYMIIAPLAQFRIQEDNTLSTHLPSSRNPVADTYRGKDKSVLEKDIQDLVAKSPEPTKGEILQSALNGADLIIQGTIQGIQGVHFINAIEKPQEWIDQMLAEGKMPGLVLTDYAIVVDKVLFDKRIYYPRFFPNYKPIEPGQTIIVTRQGGTYKGVTKIEEPGPLFEIGSREVLFLSGFSLSNYDVPDDGQSRYSTDSRMGRLLNGADNSLIAFTTKGLGSLYDGQSVGQLEQDIAEFLKMHPFDQNIPAPLRP